MLNIYCGVSINFRVYNLLEKKTGLEAVFFTESVFFTALIKNNFVLVFLLKSSILSPDSVPA